MADAIPARATPTADIAIRVVAVPHRTLLAPTSPRFHQIADHDAAEHRPDG